MCDNNRNWDSNDCLPNERFENTNNEFNENVSNIYLDGYAYIPHHGNRCNNGWNNNCNNNCNRCRCRRRCNNNSGCYRRKFRGEIDFD